MNAEYETVKKAARYARSQFNKLVDSPEYKWSHESHAVVEALLRTEAKFPELGTFGPEGSYEPEFQYLNTGDPYGTTVVYRKGRFYAGNWGDIAERYSK